MKVELFKHGTNDLRYWSAEADYTNCCIVITHGVYGGALQEQIEDVELNSSGRDVEEQVDLRIKSRAKLKIDAGYRETIEQAKQAFGKNALGFPRPMLAKRFDQLDDVDFSDCYLQMKYDGHRCLVKRTNEGLVAYSRNGNVIDTIGHILEGIHIPIGTILDGELYAHGVNLQTISSWVKKRQPNTMNLEYIVYDVISNEDYNVRYNMIRSFDMNRYAKVAPTDKSVEKEHLPMLLSNMIALGYEGLMLRQCRYPYEPGKRSKALVKVKQFLDDEFTVIGIESSRDGWAILTCETEDRKTFNVSAPGDIDAKRAVLKKPADFIGREVTVKYANLTADGIPFHPVAVAFKEHL